jgi:hypothetical protein
MTKQARSTRQRAVCARCDGILPLSNREVSNEVRQVDRKRPKPGILLAQRQNVVDSLTWIVWKTRRLFKQRRQKVEKFVTPMSERHNVVGSAKQRTEAVLLVARRTSDAHGKSPNLGRAPSRSQQLRLSRRRI